MTRKIFLLLAVLALFVMCETPDSSVPDTYTVTFNKNGGDTEASPQTKTVTSPATTIDELPLQPTRANRTFNGWNTQANGSGDAFTETTPVTANITVYAQWVLVPPPVSFVVAFDKNGGDTEASPPTKMVTSPATTIDELPTPPTRTDHTFTGWNTQADGLGTIFSADTTVTADITVYAQWLIVPPGSFVVTFDRNGGDTDADPVSKVVASPATAIDTLPAPPTRAGYDFTGWNTEANGDGTVFTAATPVTADITVYAQWELSQVEPPPPPPQENGAALTGSLTSQQVTHESISLNPINAPGNGQAVEYAISTTNSTPSSGWQSDGLFTGLQASTTYYVFARAKANDTYGAGQAISAAIATSAAPGPVQIIPAEIVTFESDSVGKTYESARGGSSPTVAVAADPVNSGQKSLRISSTDYNQAAIVPINLPYTLESYKSFTFKFNYTSGSLTNQQILVYAAKNASTFAQYGFGNPADSQYAQFAANLVGSVTPAYSPTNQWQSLTITITNPDNAIKNLQGSIFLAIGINVNGSTTYLLDDLTFNIKDNFVPPYVPPPPSTPSPPSVGAVTSGNYRNLFKEWGKTDAQIDAKVTSEWNKKFVNGTTDEMLFVQASDSSMAYIYTADTNDVRSEGMSYGMMMCVQMDDQTRFDKLWKWAHTYMYHDRTVNNTGKNVRGFFSWQCRTDGSAIDTGPAPDGEFYFVTALLFAENRWGNGSGINNYGQYARYIMYDMLHRESGVKDNWGAIPMINATHKLPEFTTVTAQHTDPSYMLPAFYDIWAMEIRAGTSYHTSIWGSTSAANADATYWEEVATSCRNYLKNSGVLNATTGLGPDYASYTGSPGSHGDFEYDAWRIAMNIAVDYAWWAKDAWQKTQSDRIQTFFYNQGVTSYGNRYTLSGNKLGSDHSPGLVACNAVASLAATHERAWEFVENLWDIPVTTGQYRYYDGCLYMMGLLHVSGKFKAYLSTGGGSPNPYISPTSATFNKYASSSDYKDIAVTMTLNGSTLSNISGGSPAITSGNYTVSGSAVTIKKEYLATLFVGATTLTFTFANGTTRSLSITIENTAPTPTITPTTATFDKKTSAQADVVVTMTLNGSTLSDIKNGNTTLTQGNNVYTVNGSTVSIKAAYLAQQANGNTTLTFTFSDGTTRNIVITIGDTTGGGTIGSGTEYDFASGANPAVTSSSNVNAAIANGVLLVTGTGNNNGVRQVMIPFDLGGSTLGSFTKLQLVVKCGGDYTYKGFTVAASGNNGSTWTDIGTTTTNDWAATFKTITINISGASTLSGAIMLRLQWPQSNPVTYEFQSIGLIN
jgi:uncharacterized repeat protein (TIGR02543 family)